MRIKEKSDVGTIERNSSNTVTGRDNNTEYTKILYIDSESLQSEHIEDCLIKLDNILYQFENITQIDELLGHIILKKPDILILNPFANEKFSVNIIERIHNRIPDLPIIAVGHNVEDEKSLEVITHGAHDYLPYNKVTTRIINRVIKYSIERHRLIARFWGLSLVDELTGLYNLRGFLNLSRQQFKQAERTGKGFHIWFFDIDNMKTINDKFGHPIGDTALVKGARIIEKSFRESDIIARIGGDEFAVLAVEAMGKQAIDSVSKRIEKTIKRANKENILEYEISMSYGCAEYKPNCSITLEDLIAMADRKMYVNKSRKRA